MDYEKKTRQELKDELVKADQRVAYMEKAEDKLRRLNSLLEGLRKVNQLITREKDKLTLLRRICDCVTETGSYTGAWIALKNGKKAFDLVVGSGLDDYLGKLRDFLLQGNSLYCIRKAMSEPGIISVYDPGAICSECPLVQLNTDRVCHASRLERGGTIFGVLVFIHTSDFDLLEETKNFLDEIAGDISFSLRDIELEEKRRAAEEALRESEERYKLLYELAGDPIFTYDNNLVLLDLNTIACNEIGMNKEDLIGRNIMELNILHPDDIAIAMDHIKLLLEGEKTQRAKLRFRRADRSYALMEVIAARIEKEEKLVGITNICHDITEQDRLLRELQKSEEKFRSLSESAPDIIFMLKTDGMITYVNPAVTSLLGYGQQEIIGRYGTDLSKKDELKYFIHLFKRVRDGKKTIRDTVVTLIHRNRSERVFSLSGAPILDSSGKVTGIVGLLKDITEHRRLEAQLRQAQKMEAIGTLAGGIAHDFNNILTAIIGYTELSLFDANVDSKVKNNLEEVLHASKRARDLVKQILAFSRQGDERRIPISLSPVIKEALKLLRASIPASIEIREKIDDSAGIVKANATQIHQILMNLCANAEHAMRQKGGILEIRLERIDVTEEMCRSNPELFPGTYVCLTVSDTGHGMPPSVMARIFEPYFTTKEKGEGTGLGLAVVHGIVKSHNGCIIVQSEVGKGTTFQLFFPVIEGVHESDKYNGELIPKGNERILFVDDEPSIIDLAKSMLERLGYVVETRSTSMEALNLFRCNPQRFDLVISDMTMPHMTGDELARKIMEIRPEIPIILCTGFSKKITPQQAQKMGIKAFVMKPLLMSELANVIRSVLDNK